jgi:hypothetical protein
MKLTGMMEYWNTGILEYWVKNRNRPILKFKLRSNPIKTNPFIPGPDRLCKKVCGNTFIYAKEGSRRDQSYKSRQGGPSFHYSNTMCLLGSPPQADLPQKAQK